MAAKKAGNTRQLSLPFERSTKVSTRKKAKTKSKAGKKKKTKRKAKAAAKTKHTAKTVVAQKRGSKKIAATAESMAAKQRDISVSEFFAKNRHLLGFDNPRKSLLTAVKEAVAIANSARPSS